jgi:hypothetical protein
VPAVTDDCQTAFWAWAICTKKRLSERWHVLGDGSGVVQRDLYSAFLAAIADQDLIHPSRAATAWPAAQSLLARAGWVREQPVSVASLLAATLEADPLPAPEPVARERAPVQGDTSKGLSVSRTSRKVLKAGLRTPCLQAWGDSGSRRVASSHWRRARAHGSARHSARGNPRTGR